MLRTRFAIGLLLILGAFVAVSGSAAALTPVGELVCSVIYGSVWNSDPSSPADPGRVWWYGIRTLDEGGHVAAGAIATALDVVDGALPDQDPENPLANEDRLDRRDQICVHFLSICGPVFALADRV